MTLTKNDYIEMRELIRERDQLNERLAILENSITSVKAQQLTGMPHNPSNEPDKIGEAIGRMETLWDNLIAQNGVIAAVQAKREEVIRVLPVKHRILMRYRYCDGMRWEEIAIKMRYVKRHIFRLHKESLRIMKDVTQCH